MEVTTIISASVLSLATMCSAHAGELTEAEFKTLHAELQPDNAALWRTIPWKTSVLDAQQAAAEAKKPLFIWAMDGHPLGCTWNNGVIDRASIFADTNIVELIKTQTIPVAIDQWNQRRQKDSEGDFYRKIAAQGPRNDFENGTTQGLYLAAADGTFLGYTNNRHPDRVKQFFESGLQKHQPLSTSKLTVESQDKRFTYEPPAGGLVVRVQAKVLAGYEPPETEFEQIFQTSVSRDNLWLTKEENESLAAGTFPKSAALRLVRYHLVDNTRGEPPFWETGEVVSESISLKDGTITGHVELKSKDSSRTYSADLLGYVTASQGKVTRFDVVAKGQFSGSGRYTGRAPKGKFPLAVSFTLADGKDLADGIPPQGARGWVANYLR